MSCRSRQPCGSKVPVARRIIDVAELIFFKIFYKHFCERARLASARPILNQSYILEKFYNKSRSNELTGIANTEAFWLVYIDFQIA